MGWPMCSSVVARRCMKTIKRNARFSDVVHAVEVQCLVAVDQATIGYVG
jgi:hypothetical protein